MKSLNLSLPKELVKVDKDLSTEECFAIFEQVNEIVIACSQQTLNGKDILFYNEIISSQIKDDFSISISEGAEALLKTLYLKNNVNLQPKHVKLYCFYRGLVEAL